MAAEPIRTALLFLVLLALASSVAAASTAPAPARAPTATGCRRGDLVVRQRATGRVVEGKPEYAVEVRNACRCAQSRVLLRCYGLSSVGGRGPARHPRRGRPALPPRGGAVRFTYAWMTPQDFPLLSSRPHC
ncbi:uncharacterized protein LOC103646559 precursor [Zea mays]|jgi:hypothetical protein|uniref:Beta-13-N-Acetylglucosaminyltransferase family protein n=1 Tax=Zea mays TaxID=4577 RepID=A0A1D6ECE2_MAIZE|nr:uncharacterized protein LOC103646559 precursor [Zea mays]ONM17987.1 Beta-13-N-Acetylglucosaminyltransferase family protein [Zea mays]